ncbi:MAG: hypothetical protein HYY84_18195 [Deltaproteobacteria bacterium]|nr:hypothetical protein [Deltaproteobacteria bacterium]
MSPEPESFRRRAAWAVLLAVAPLAAYSSAFENGFIGEDRRGIVDNRLIRSLGNIPDLFRHHTSWSGGSRAAAVQRSTDTYRPIPAALVFLEYAIAGPAPFFFHASSVLFHIANVFLLVFVATGLGLRKSSARLAALIFAVHPAIAEAIHLINACSDPLALFFFLSAVALWQRKRSAGLISGAAVAVLFFCATLCKETAFLVATVVLFLVRGWHARPRHALMSLVPWIVGGACGLMARWAVLGGSGVSATESDWVYSLYRVPLIWLDAVRSFLIPVSEIQVNLLEAYRDPAAATVVAAAALSASFLVAAVIAVRHRFALGLAILWVFCVTMAPVALLTRHASWFGWGRYLYLSAPFVSLGIAVLVFEVVVPKVTQRLRPFALAAGVAVLLFLALQTFWAGRAFRSDRAFAEAAIADHPDISVGYANLGEIEINDGNHSRGLSLAEKAISLDPRSGRNWSLAASALMHLGRFPEAYRAAERAIAAGVEDGRAAYIIAIRHLSERRDTSAARILLDVISDDPEKKGPWGTLRRALASRGRNSEFARVVRERLETPALLPLAPAIRAMLAGAPESPTEIPLNR